MGDTLRDRIAALIAESYPGKYGYPTALFTADAVIAELGLRIDRVGSVSRWVSEWVPDE